VSLLFRELEDQRLVERAELDGTDVFEQHIHVLIAIRLGVGMQQQL
jgi:hypothetical protein